MRALPLTLSLLIACQPELKTEPLPGDTAPPEDTALDDTALDDTAPPEDADGDGYSVEDGDCDDADPAVHPGASEICDDELDNDCDGKTDDSDLTAWYVDQDGDGVGGALDTVSCAQPEGAVAEDGDCDDADPEVHAGGTWYPDEDGDGQGVSDEGVNACAPPPGYSDTPGDCDDHAPLVYTGAAELCDGAANDCSDLEGWSPELESGTVTFVSEAGVVTDYSLSISQDPGWVTPLDLSEDGTLYFCAGPDAPVTWYLSMDIAPVDLRVVGVNGREVTILSGAGRERIATVNNVTGASATLALSGLTLTDGYTADRGGAVYLDFTTMTVSDCAFHGNVAETSGGAIAAIQKRALTVSSSVFSGNDGGAAGGAIYAYWTDISLEDVEVEGNAATDGGGVYQSTYGSLVAEDTRFRDNVARGSGGAVYLYAGAAATLGSGVELTGNEAALYGGGLIVGGYGATATMTDGASVSDNQADYGGGVFASGASFTAEAEATIDSNHARRSGGGLYAQDTAVALESGAAIDSNHATSYGGGLYAYHTAIGLNESALNDNTADVHGGGAYVRDSTALCTDSALTDNLATSGFGPGFYLIDADDSDGLAARFTGVRCAVNNTVHVYNTSSDYDLSGTPDFICDANGCS